MSTQTVAGVDWNQVHDRLKKHWGLLTDRDLAQADGNVRRLVGIVQQVTGRDRDEVERFVNDTVEGATSAFGRFRSKAAEFAGHSSEAVTRGFQHAMQRASSDYEAAGAMVKRRPFQSTAAALGAGVLAGFAIGWLIRRE